MSRLADMPIGNKIHCCLGIVLLPVVLVMGTSLWTVLASRTVHVLVTDDVVPELLAFTDLREKGLRLVDSLDKLAVAAESLHDNLEKLAETVGRERPALEVAANAFAISREAVVALTSLGIDPAIADSYAQLIATAQELARMPTRVVSVLSNAPTIDEIIRFRRQFKDRAYRFRTLIDDAVTHEKHELTEASENLTATIEVTLAIMAGGLLLILAAYWLSATHLSRRLTQNIRELILAKERAQSADRTKSQFLANMSHELRTPLNAIIGFSEIIHTQSFGPITQPKYVDYARDILDSGGHLLGIVNSILDLSKIDAGGYELSEEPCEIREIIAGAIRMIVERAAQAGLTVAQEVPEGLPSIRADARALMQILVNLLGNAVKFTPSGGRILVAAGVLDQGGLSLRVGDNGIGIRPEYLGKIFDRFAQADDTHTRRHGGAGLGLHITRTLVELHDGTIQIDSELGAGTIVTITLPPERVLPREAPSGRRRIVAA